MIVISNRAQPCDYCSQMKILNFYRFLCAQLAQSLLLLLCAQAARHTLQLPRKPRFCPLEGNLHGLLLIRALLRGGLNESLLALFWGKRRRGKSVTQIINSQKLREKQNRWTEECSLCEDGKQHSMHKNCGVKSIHAHASLVLKPQWNNRKLKKISNIKVPCTSEVK